MWWFLVVASYANERQFTYVADALPLAADLRELELLSTTSPTLPSLDVVWRVELEFPIAPRVLGAAYVNLGHDPADQGLSYELKATLASPLTAPVGLALYGEATINRGKQELEAKVILDKRIQRLILVANLIGSGEREVGDAEIAWPVGFEPDLAAAVRVGTRGSVGAEARAPIEFIEGSVMHGEVGVGPAVSYRSRNGWWVAATALPRLAAFGPEGDDTPAWQVRTIMAFTL